MGVQLPRIRISHVEKRYFVPRLHEEVVALSPTDLDIEDGEFVCVLGPSGCGKSTLLNCIAGVVPTSGGEILIDGRPVHGPGRERGMVFQEYALFPWMTVIENIEFGPRMRHVSELERRASSNHYIELVGLGGWEHRYPNELSGGMRQRVGIARALANEPDVLLMDEPFGALDALTRDRMQEELLSIWQQDKKTCVFVTHSISEAVFLADRIVVFSPRPGRILEIVRLSEERPRQRSSPEFMAAYDRIDALLRSDPRP